MIKKIVIAIGEKEIELSEKEARELYGELDRLLGVKDAIGIPYIPRYPVYPTYPNPNYPVYPTWSGDSIKVTWSDTTGGTV